MRIYPDGYCNPNGDSRNPSDTLAEVEGPLPYGKYVTVGWLIDISECGHICGNGRVVSGQSVCCNCNVTISKGNRCPYCAISTKN